MIDRILIANRGEIAVRIIRACREMGIETVAVYSREDRDSLHVILADEAYCIGKGRVTDSYLKGDTMITIALASGCTAVHPGYGLLSENADFARKVTEEGLIFIGPSAELIERLGDKEGARKLMKSNGVPVIPGAENIEDEKEAEETARNIGYPVLLKAASGGGGKGIRAVERKEDLLDAWNMVRREAEASFGDSRVYMEKYLTDVKHVELQVLADSYGNVAVLGARDCSIQRRNQKLIEETPCIHLPHVKYRELREVTENAMRNIGYTGAGTLEFLMDRNGDTYFMEMNTRLQVEHTVTEMVTGIDLVKWQIRIASGVSMEGLEVESSGHSIECRILAEDPEKDFMPQSGRIDLLLTPGGPGVRFDTYLYSGAYIPPYYDSMIGKLIVHDATREDAVRKMRSALGELVVRGVVTSKDFEIDILSSPLFTTGKFTTKDLENGKFKQSSKKID